MHTFLKDERKMVRPVELQDNLSKAPLAAREQHLQQTRPDLAQRAIAQETAQEYLLDHTRTRPTEEKHPAEMHVYDHGRRAAEEERQRKREERGSAESSAETEERGSGAPADDAVHIDFIA